MDDSESNGGTPHPSDFRNSLPLESPSLDQILIILNKKLSDCREHFMQLYPRRPAQLSEVLCGAGSAESCEIGGEDDVEYADNVTNTIEFGTSLFYNEDKVRLFAMHLCSLQSDLVWSRFGLRVVRAWKGIHTRFEVECHETVAFFESNEWLQSQFSAFQSDQTDRPDKRRKLDNKAEGQVFVQKNEFQRQKWKIDVYKTYVQDAHTRIAELEASLAHAVAEIALVKSHSDELLHTCRTVQKQVRLVRIGDIAAG